VDGVALQCNLFGATDISGDCAGEAMSWKIPEGTIFYHYGEELASVSQTFDIQPHHVGGWLIDKNGLHSDSMTIGAVPANFYVGNDLQGPPEEVIYVQADERYSLEKCAQIEVEMNRRYGTPLRSYVVLPPGVSIPSQQNKDAVTVVRCAHCGGWAAWGTACVHCGAPVV
jgi:hypothetical protein